MMMKQITFKVDELSMRLDTEKSDAINIGDKVQANFVFSEDWDHYAKVAGFLRGRTEFKPAVLKNGSSCIIPAGAINGTFFRITVFGKTSDSIRNTNGLIVNVGGDNR